MDTLLLQKYECVCPFQTNQKNEKQCELESYSFEKQEIFKNDYKGNFHVFLFSIKSML